MAPRGRERFGQAPAPLCSAGILPARRAAGTAALPGRGPRGFHVERLAPASPASELISAIRESSLIKGPRLRTIPAPMAYRTLTVAPLGASPALRPRPSYELKALCRHSLRTPGRPAGERRGPRSRTGAAAGRGGVGPLPWPFGHARESRGMDSRLKCNAGASMRGGLIRGQEAQAL